MMASRSRTDATGVGFRPQLRHHTAADTLDKVDPRELAEDAAALAIAAYVLADQPAALPRPAAPAGPEH